MKKTKRGVDLIKKKFRENLGKLSTFEKQVKKNTATAILAAFAFIIALVWRDAIQSVVNDILSYLNVTGTTSKYHILVAFLTTIICVLGIMYFPKWSEGKK